MVAAASETMFTRTRAIFGPAHGTTMVRKLELATALANAGGLSEAQRMLREIIAASPEPVWLLSVSKVELARALRDCGEIKAACDVLESLVPCLSRATARWAQHEHVEACTILGDCYTNMGRLDQAEKKLFLSIDHHLNNENCCEYKMVHVLKLVVRLFCYCAGSRCCCICISRRVLFRRGI